jgi:DinB superfamily
MNVIPDATDEPRAYVDALLRTLGEREPLEVYRTTPDVIADRCADLPVGRWHSAPGPAEWSAYQIIGHVFDVDIVYGFRWRLVLTADTPTYPGYDEKEWARLPKPEPEQLLAAISRLRAANVELIESLGPEQLAREGVHSEQGLETVDLMIRKIAGHDLAHLDQLDRAIGSRGREGALSEMANTATDA